ncbi:hypothetical protein LNP18_06340 [Leuconostoc citreum]|uniref:hypothetical protein n=1 Tax=Leuconostoc citreum TaxID=33964 RepID=UPI00200B9E15|nr:hypothetical protein [Leuconostoc citreum]MCK8605722.1 hypothetical protein [Leuconostoc citreum]
MKKAKIFSSSFRQVIDHRYQQLSAVTGTLIGSMTPLIASADVGDAAKSSGTSVAGLLFIALVIVGGITLLIASIMVATGSQKMHEQGVSKAIKALFGIAGGCLVGMILTWIIGVATSAGGGNFINWQF